VFNDSQASTNGQGQTRRSLTDQDLRKVIPARVQSAIETSPSTPALELACLPHARQRSHSSQPRRTQQV